MPVVHVNESEIAGERAPLPNARTLKHLAAPWTLGTERLWVGLSEIDPGSSSNLQSQESEEAFYVVARQGEAAADHLERLVVQELLVRSGVIEDIGRANVFESMEEAIRESASQAG